MQSRKNFIPKNDGFVCDACGTTTPPAKGTFRNHCPVCLASKHVDQEIPGDRLSTCLGLMPAVAIEGTDPDKLDIIHVCQKCGKRIANKIATDDDKTAIFALMKRQNPASY
jgi:hypothetical protein